MRREPVRSSNIDSVGYDSGVLEISFRSGGIYQYRIVPEHIYLELMNAPSKGGYFHDHIKDRYDTRKVG